MKKILISLGTIVAVAVLVIGGTIAYFNDTETSTDNIFTAGSIDLKVDHIKQVYNGVDCKTCVVEIKSDTTDIVVGTVDGDDPVSFPHAAVEVSNPHPAWTVTGDIPGATWIWATDPVTTHDAGNTNVYYTFEKTFTWWGPVDGITLELGVGTDNGYEVELNGNPVGDDWGEYNYKSPADVYTNFGSYIVQGLNTLTITVKNQAVSGGTPSGNPAGLLYKLTIDGDCDDDHFKSFCSLWGETDLDGSQQFYNFDDIKPGDWGVNVISLHVYDNDAWACLIVHDVEDYENTIVDPEEEAGDTTDPEGELGSQIEVFAWIDDGDGEYEPSSETGLGGGTIDTEIVQLQLQGSVPSNVAIAWCAGDQTVDTGTGEITCDGSGMDDTAQTDQLSISSQLDI